MKPAFKRDLDDLTDILENFASKLGTFSEADLIDLAARLKPVAKHCKAMDDYAKDYIRGKLAGVEGTRLGNEFKATLKLVDTTRLNQKLLKEEQPKVHARYNVALTDERISFELR